MCLSRVFKVRDKEGKNGMVFCSPTVRQTENKHHWRSEQQLPQAQNSKLSLPTCSSGAEIKEVSLLHVHVLFFNLIKRTKEGREEILLPAYAFCFKSIESGMKTFTSSCRSLLAASSCWLPAATRCFSCTLAELISSYFFSSTYLLPGVVQVSITAHHLNLATKFALCMWGLIWSFLRQEWAVIFGWRSKISMKLTTVWVQLRGILHILLRLFKVCFVLLWHSGSPPWQSVFSGLTAGSVPPEHGSSLADHGPFHPSSSQSCAEVKVCQVWTQRRKRGALE